MSDINEIKKELEASSREILREQIIKQCAAIARNACLVPPDGGSPTEEERLVCEAAEQNILALLSCDDWRSTR